MRVFFGIALCAALILPSVHAQGVVNGGFNALNIEGPVGAVIGTPGPATVMALTDSPVDVEVQGGFGVNPVIMLFSGAVTPGPAVINPNVLNIMGLQIDLTDVNSNGYADQFVFNGLTNPNPSNHTGPNGKLNVALTFPACRTINNQLVCVTAPTFDVAIQAIVYDASSPIGLSSTGTGLVNYLNGFQQFNFTGGGSDQFATFNFKQGMTFPMYGGIYTQAHVSENAVIQFGSTSNLNQFPNLDQTQVNNGGRRIMSFYTDLDPDGGQAPVIYAQQFEEQGVKKVRFIHRGIAEFGNATGPHGGTITITELGEIAVFVISQAQPSIDMAVGITAGSFGTNAHPLFGPFGVDLTAAVSASAVGNLASTGPMGNAYEFFDEAAGTQNALDLIGLYLFNGSSVGPGVLFIPEVGIPNSYIIQ